MKRRIVLCIVHFIRWLCYASYVTLRFIFISLRYLQLFSFEAFCFLRTANSFFYFRYVYFLVYAIHSCIGLLAALFSVRCVP